MATNDTVDLVFDEPDRVPVGRLLDLTRALERALGGALSELSQRRFGNPNQGEAGDRFAPTTVIAASARPGSLVLPLLFELGDIHVQMFAPMPAAKGEPREWLTSIADVATILDISLQLLFGRWGIIARQTGQAPVGPPPAELRAEAAIAEEMMSTARTWVDDIQKRSEAIGCARVRVRYRDAELDLVIEGRTRSFQRLGGNHAVEQLFPTTSARKDELNFVRPAGPIIQVEYKDRPVPAYLAHAGQHAQKVIMIGRGDGDIPPEGIPMQARGEFPDRADIRPLEDVPEDWSKAVSVFSITGIKSSNFV